LRDFVSREYEYHKKDPRGIERMGRTRESKSATMHGDGGLETTVKHTAQQRETPILPRFRALVKR
jgi:hypothetical protein